ncbi:MAG: DALR anticodon-binding domain-containing protein, partial [bacterium]|nr:DALR anticodon-binding domain-containing protein [bacterium]
DPKTNIVFDWNEILNMEGNSGPYLQYTVARCNSVIFKGPTLQGSTFKGLERLNLNSEELSVLRKLSQFHEVIVTAAKSYSPNLLCNYLYDLAQKYNGFYNKHKIISDSGHLQNFRLLLTKTTGQVLKNGLKILGIQAPERM